MKSNRTLFSLAVAAICLAASQSTSAQTSVKPTFVALSAEQPKPAGLEMKVITDLNPQKFILSVNNPQSENLKVSVEGIGGIVYRTQINVSFSKRFDMSGIEDGEYTVIVYNGKTTYRKTVLLNTKDDMSRSLAVN